MERVKHTVMCDISTITDFNDEHLADKPDKQSSNDRHSLLSDWSYTLDEEDNFCHSELRLRAANEFEEIQKDLESLDGGIEGLQEHIDLLKGVIVALRTEAPDEPLRAVLKFDIDFDDSVFVDADARHAITPVEQTKLKELVSNLSNLRLSYGYNGTLSRSLFGSEWTDLGADLIPLTRFLCDEINIVSYDQEGVESTTKQKLKDMTDLLPYVRLSMTLYQTRCKKPCPADWSDGDDGKIVPFSQILFVVACVTRLKWNSFSIKPDFFADPHKLKKSRRWHFPSDVFSNTLLVDTPAVSAYIENPNPEYNTFNEDGSEYSTHADHTGESDVEDAEDAGEPDVEDAEDAHESDENSQNKRMVGLLAQLRHN